jgi:hypothetical protein
VLRRTQHPANADLARPRRAQRAEQAAASHTAPAAAGVTPDPAALARPPRRPPVDLLATPAGPTTYRTADPGPRRTRRPVPVPGPGSSRAVRGLVRCGVRGCGCRDGQDPARCPRANCFAERLVLTVRTELTDQMPIFGERHLRRVLATYATHYNGQRPHRALQLTSAARRCTCPQAGLRQDPASTDSWRPPQPIRTRSLKPLVTPMTEFWHPTGSRAVKL